MVFTLPTSRTLYFIQSDSVCCDFIHSCASKFLHLRFQSNLLESVSLFNNCLIWNMLCLLSYRPNTPFTRSFSVYSTRFHNPKLLDLTVKYKSNGIVHKRHAKSNKPCNACNVVRVTIILKVPVLWLCQRKRGNSHSQFFFPDILFILVQCVRVCVNALVPFSIFIFFPKRVHLYYSYAIYRIKYLSCTFPIQFNACYFDVLTFQWRCCYFCWGCQRFKAIHHNQPSTQRIAAPKKHIHIYL